MATTDSNEYENRVPTFQETNDIYLLPNDAQEHERLISQHKALVALAKGRLIHAPVQGPIRKVIDVGCGTGIMTRELRKEFPDADCVYGIDLSPVKAEPGDQDEYEDEDEGEGKGEGHKQKEDGAEAANATQPPPHRHRRRRAPMSFVQGDIMALAGADPRFAWESVNFAWSRLLVCGLVDWPGYVGRVFRLLRPGGWAQMSDFCEDVYFAPVATASASPAATTHPTTRSRPATFRANEQWGWLKALREGGRRKGLDVDAGRNVPRYMADAGFVDVSTVELRIPYWRGAVEKNPEARLAVEHHVGDRWFLWYHMIPSMVKGMGHSQEQIRAWQEECRKDLQEEVGKYQIFCVTIGRKPN